MKDDNCICRKLPSLDPRGRGSSAAGGIVMDLQGWMKMGKAWKDGDGGLGFLASSEERKRKGDEVLG